MIYRGRHCGDHARLIRPFAFNIFEQYFNFLQGLPRRSQRRRHVAKTHAALLQFPLPHGALPLNSRLNSTLDGQVIGLRRCTRALVVFDLALQFGDSPARLIEASDFLFYLMRQVTKLGQHSANRPRWRRRREKMTLAGAWMRAPNFVRAEAHNSRLTQRRTEGVKLTLPHIAQLEPIGLGKAKRVPCPHLVGIEPRAPDDHVVGLSRGVLVELRQALRGDDPGVTALASLAHQADDRFGGFRFTRAALRAIDMRLVKNHQSWPPKVAWQVDERLEKKLDEAAPLSELQLVEIDHRRDLVLEQPAREQRGVARICRQFTAGADQQHVHRLTQTCELALIVEDDGLDPGALSNEPQQPRLAAAGIGLD